MYLVNKILLGIFLQFVYCIDFSASVFTSFRELEAALLQATSNEYGGRPQDPVDSDGAVDVSVRVVVTDVQPIKRESIDVIAHIQSIWKDTRLQYNVTSRNPMKINETLAYSLHNRVWKPDLYLEPEWTLNSDSEIMLIRVNSNGNVGSNKRFRSTIPCTKSFIGIMHVDFICTTRVLSYSYLEDEVKLSWLDDDPLRLKYGAIDVESEITRGVNETCSWDIFNGMRTSCVEVKLYVTRHFPSIFYRLYIPSFMAVLMAWSSFWIHRDEASARIKLGTLVVWTVMSQYISIEVAFPEYLDNIAGNVWMFGCIFFTWASFILYVIIHVVRRREKSKLKHDEKKEKEREKEAKRTGERALSISSVHPDGKLERGGLKGYSVWRNKNKFKVTKIYMSSFTLERWCRIWYGLLFLGFTIFFLTFYGMDLFV
ncbi:glycine receptor subunit alpha-4-like [Ruditapes philippinarum]|uniref:glycine receptor subunit alpha-4-like n=1 Tax=Ruditapes philippinarum TaxID=129788 RepID=UPI00295BB3D6|nr:glycine receptor subunit alpha-4-like [Ruditapes philippinarum]